MDLVGIDHADSLLDDGANEVKLLLPSEALLIALVGPDTGGENPGVIGESECRPQYGCTPSPGED